MFLSQLPNDPTSASGEEKSPEEKAALKEVREARKAEKQRKAAEKKAKKKAD